MRKLQVFFLYALMFCSFSGARSQVGIQPLGTYSSGADNINISTLFVHYDIPLFTRKERGVGTDISVHLVYDGGALSDGYGSTIVSWGGSGWRLALDTSASASGHVTTGTYGNSSCPLVENPQDRYFDYTVTDNSGFTHYFPFESHYDGCTGDFTSLSSPVAATDGSGYLLVSTAYGTRYTIATPSGSRIFCSQTSDAKDLCTTTDPNGNSSQVHLDVNGFSYSDPAGSYLNISGAYSDIYFSSTPIAVSYKDTQGTIQTVTVNTQGYSVFSPVMFPSDPGTGTVYFPSSVQFPDGTSYAFTYEPSARYSGNYTGRLSSVTLPTGGTINYSYTDGPDRDSEGNFLPYISSLTRTTGDGAVTYNASGSGLYTNTASELAFRQTTVNEGARTTTYNFVGSTSGYLETNRAVFEGNSTSGSPVETISRCYNGATTNCGSSNISGTVTQIDTTVTHGVTSRTVEYLNSVSLPTEVDEYDFGASTPTRKTFTTYANIGNYISDHIQSVTVKNGNDQTVSQVSYGYDEGSLLGTSGLASHGAVTGARGNRTSQHVWINTTGGTIDTGWKYDDAGQVRGQKDGLGNWTLFDYDTATDSCLSKRTYAYTVPGAGAPISESATCNAYTGVQESATDMNGTVTTYSYDPMLRLSGTTTRDSSNTLQAEHTTAYAYSGGHQTVTSTTRSDPSPASVTVKTLDGYGRTYSESLANNATVDTRYDSLGRVHTVSNPYFSPSDSTYGVTTYGYDALNRQTSVSQSDGVSSTSTTYSGKTVTSIDERGSSYDRDYDVWGNITRVQEPGGTQTSYTYDLLGNLTVVNQNGLTRSFAYDSASQLRASYNPETGNNQTCSGVSGSSWSLCYSYDSNGNLVSKTDARGKTINYVYDAMNRVVSKSFSDGTRTQHYGYDGNDEGGNSLGAPWTTNAIGRLSHTSDAISVASNYSYDVMGRLIHKQDCCGSSPPAEFATYDLAGNLTSLTYPDGRVVAQGYDSAGRVNGVYGNAVGGPQYAGLTYHADGSLNAMALGTSGIQTSRSENSRLQTCSEQASWGSNPLYSRTYSFGPSGGSSCGAVAGNNGNIWQVQDVLGTESQAMNYDTLNRLTSWDAPGMTSAVRHLNYTYDSFGNMTSDRGYASASTLTGVVNQSRPFANLNYNGSVGPYNTKNQLVDSTFDCVAAAGSILASGTSHYDAAGNVLCDGSNNDMNAHQYIWDADSHLVQVNAQPGSGTTYYKAAAYLYDAMGQRVRVDQYTPGNPNSTGWRQYTYFGGKVIAETDQTEGWTDYIFAGDKRIAKIDPAQWRIHMHGNNLRSVFGGGGIPLQPLPRPIQAGDKLVWRQYNGGTSVSGGLFLSFTNQTNNAWNLVANDGSYGNMGGGANTWASRVADLSPDAGKMPNGLSIVTDFASQLGVWDVWYADVAIVGTDGMVQPLFRGNNVSLANSVWLTDFSAQTESSVCIEYGSSCVTYTSAQPTAGSGPGLTWLASDHLGTAQLEFSLGGWPVWKGEFAPFGQELDTQPTANRYKFTGKERDAESALDYFGARFMGSTMGRFISPDWSDSPDAVPYADLGMPQSLNLYAYAGNNPVSASDTDGHMAEWGSSSRERCPDGTIADTCAVAKVNDPFQVNINTLMQVAKSASNAISNTVQTAESFISTNQTLCKVSTTVSGAAGGALVGGEAGGLVGGAIGATGGTFALPVGGTLAGGAGGAAIGATVGGVGGGVAGGVAGYAAGNAMCSSGGSGNGGGGNGGGGLSGRARSKLGNLGARAGEKVRDVIRSRGGSGSNVNQAGQWADRTLGEAAEAAARGDSSAETAVKIAKQAGRLGQKY